MTTSPAHLPTPASTTKPWNPAITFAFRFGFACWLLFGFQIVGTIPTRLIGALYQAIYTTPEQMANPGWFGKSLDGLSDALSWPVTQWMHLWSGNFPTAPNTKLDPNVWNGLVTWVAQNVGFVQNLINTLPEDSRDSRPQFQSGSGDQLHNWLLVGCYVALSLTIAITWSAIHWKSPGYPRLAAFLRRWVRAILIITLLGYGFAKVFPSQFQTPAVFQLLKTYGDSSPMNILWTFMGASMPYTIFAGAAEVLGGVLLMFRRTVLLGALVAIGVMTNVFMLNLCYDVPVKLYSGMYLLAAIWLVIPDLPRLLYIFVTNSPCPPAEMKPPFRRAALNRTWFTLKWLTLAALLTSQITSGYQGYQSVLKSQQLEGLNGSYVIDSFQRDGVEVPALITDHTRWKRIRISMSEFGNTFGIRSLSDIGQALKLTHDADKKTFTITPTPQRAVGPKGETDDRVIPGTEPVTFTYTEPEPGKLILEGAINGTKLTVTMSRLDSSKFLLLNRGFHWISQFPFNR